MCRKLNSTPTFFLNRQNPSRGSKVMQNFLLHKLTSLNGTYLFLVKLKMTGAQTDIPLSSRGFGAFLIPEGWLSGLQSCFQASHADAILDRSSFPGWVCPRQDHPQNFQCFSTETPDIYNTL